MKHSFFDLLSYYTREKNYLKNMGSAFAQQYPKIANRLDIGHDTITDPNVDRLIDSFAFLTAFLQKDIENEFPRISTALLTSLYPQFTNPIPPISIAHFQVDPTKGKLTSGFCVPKETPLFARAQEGVTCQFQTGYDVELWPVSVEEASLVSTNSYNFSSFFTHYPYCLHLTLRPMAGSLKDLSLKTLRFYIKGSRALQEAFYEGIFTDAKSVGVALNGGLDVLPLPLGSLSPVGLKKEDLILPFSDQTHPAYALLLEYFYCKEKFFFFDLSNLNILNADSQLDILIPVSNATSLLKFDFSKDTFCLGCTPILNIFKKISEPFKLSHYTSEVRLVGDQRRELTTEIYSILSVQGVSPDGLTTTTIPPYFAFDYASSITNPTTFWYTQRVPSVTPGLPGTDVNLSFVNLDLNPHSPSNIETIFAYTLCTNRSLAPELPAGTLLEVSDTLPTTNIVCLLSPSPSIYPPTDGKTLWALVSQLSLSKLSLSNSSESLSRLKGILNLYSSFGDGEGSPEVETLVNLSCSYSVERLGTEAWRNFSQGISLTLTVDEQYTIGSSPFLFVSVLNQFFGLYVSINSFTQLNLKKINQEGYWKQWTPICGNQLLL